MEKRNHFLLNQLVSADFKEDQFSLEPQDAKAGSGTISSTGGIDWKMVSEAPLSSGNEIHYSENVMDGPAPGGIRPINHEEDAERCIMIMDLPEPTESRRMKVVVEDVATGFVDSVQMKMEKGSYQTLLASLADEIFFSGTNFFSISLGKDQFVTYINLNDLGKYAKLEYTKQDTFDKFRFSFLTRS